jgi:signal transduction histidine kinase
VIVRGGEHGGEGTRVAGRVFRVPAVVGGASVAAFGVMAGAGAVMLEGPALGGLLRALGVAAVAVVPWAVGVAWWFAGRVEQDLRRVAAGVQATAGGHTVAIASLDEVGEVTRQVEVLRRHYAHSVDRAREARRQAEQADRDKTEFLTSVSHELRTPLNAIVGFADVLLAEIDGPLNPSQHEDVATIRGAGVHLVALFNDVLDLSAAASGHLRLTWSAVALSPIIDAVAAELRGQRQDRPVEVHVHAPPDLPDLWGDPKRMRQVVTNLASNALKFTERGEVRLEAEQDGDQVILRIIDTGPGIAPEELPLLFAEFGQAGDAVRRLKGTGLGLAISRQLVELHGGTIDVSSEVGLGTTVRVCLPVGRPR